MFIWITAGASWPLGENGLVLPCCRVIFHAASDDTSN